jgi:hypothetical protein
VKLGSCKRKAAALEEFENFLVPAADITTWRLPGFYLLVDLVLQI